MFTRYVIALIAFPLILGAANPDKPIVRYTPMEAAPRSVYVPLSENLHLAFDMDLLRIHTVWRGDGLRVNGTPHRSSKTPFTSMVQGSPLHTTPALYGWSVGEQPQYFQDKIPRGNRFRGTRQLDGTTTFLFDIAKTDGTPIAIEQSAHAIPDIQIGFANVLRIDPCDEMIWYTFDFEHGNPSTYVFEPDGKIGGHSNRNNTRWFAADSSAPVSFMGIAADGSFHSRMNVANGGASELHVEKFEGTLKHIFLKIPPHDEKVTVVFIPTMMTPGDSMTPRDVDRTEDTLNKFVESLTASEPNERSVEHHDVKGMKIRAPRGDDYYAIESFPLPPEVELKVTGMDWLLNGDLAVCTWAGEIWIVENHSGDVADVTYRLFAEGLNEPQGLTVVDGEIVVAQKPELTRVLDTNDDGFADTFECINNGWDHTGNYDAFVFGPVVDSDGNFYVTSPGQRARQDVKYAGWTIRISPDGSNVEGISSGHRVPNGIGFYGSDNDLFVTDNQGNWIGACKLNHVKPGGFYGFPATTPAPPAMWDTPPDDFTPPAVWFPRKFSPSSSGFTTVPDEGFGPFGGQMIMADFQNSVALRVQLEKVNGEWQGTTFPFMKGFESGANRVAFDPKGRLYIGGVKNKAWAALGPFEQSLERVSWKGETPFSVKAVYAKPDGFELEFTKPQLEEFANDPESYFVSQFNYKHHQTYGSPQFDHDGQPGSATEIKVTNAKLSKDGLKVRLTLNGLKTGYVTRFVIPDIESTDGDFLWHDEFFYTLNKIPTE